MRVTVQNGRYRLTDEQTERCFRCDIELSRGAEQRVHDSWNRGGELSSLRQATGLRTEGRTSPARGLSLASDEA